MSYTRRFKKNITVHYSGSVSYPASQSGGTRSYSGSTTETVVFDVTVDTDPFDEEIDNMKGHVDLLTGSVVAAEAAHVDVIGETSRKIGDTIISGFFKTVKSDISQQIAELKTKSEALLLQLNKLAQRCNEKKKQMGIDYQRIAERYGKIFTDLNNELENRIYSIDEPVFTAVRTIDSSGSKTVSNDLVSTVSLSSGEQARLHSKLSANLVKKQAINAIEKGKRFLAVQYATDNILDKCLLPERKGELLSSPFCILETTNENGVSHRSIYTSPLLNGIAQDSLADKLEPKLKSRFDENDVRAIGDYFNASVAEEISNSSDSHSRRVAELTSKLFDLSNTASTGE